MKPVACIVDDEVYFADEIDWEELQGIPLYTAPKELSDEEIDRIITDCGYKIEETVMGKFVDIEGINMYNSLCEFAKAILKKAREK